MCGDVWRCVAMCGDAAVPAQALPASVTRTLLLADDAILLTDVGELHAAALRGKVAAVFEDCSIAFESIFNYHHPLFATKHARSSCIFDASTMLIDLPTWRKEDVPSRLIDLIGSQRREAADRTPDRRPRQPRDSDVQA